MFHNFRGRCTRQFQVLPSGSPYSCSSQAPPLFHCKWAPKRRRQKWWSIDVPLAAPGVIKYQRPALNKTLTVFSYQCIPSFHTDLWSLNGCMAVHLVFPLLLALEKSNSSSSSPSSFGITPLIMKRITCRTTSLFSLWNSSRPNTATHCRACLHAQEG